MKVSCTPCVVSPDKITAEHVLILKCYISKEMASVNTGTSRFFNYHFFFTAVK